jgi:hypothetical protein
MPFLLRRSRGSGTLLPDTGRLQGSSGASLARAGSVAPIQVQGEAKPAARNRSAYFIPVRRAAFRMGGCGADIGVLGMRPHEKMAGWGWPVRVTRCELIFLL